MKWIRSKDMQHWPHKPFIGNWAKTAKDRFTSAFNRCCPGKRRLSFGRTLCREYPGPRCKLSAQKNWPCVLPFVLRTLFHLAQKERQTVTQLIFFFWWNKLFKSPAGYHETKILQPCTVMSLHPLCLTELSNSSMAKNTQKSSKLLFFSPGLLTHLPKSLFLSVFPKQEIVSLSGGVSHWHT